MENSPAAPLQRAVDFFQRAGLTRTMQLLRAKYLERGAVSGQIVIYESTPEERRNLASFLAKAPYQEANLRLRLRDIDNALLQSGFSCTLPELLAAFFPDIPLITRPEQRQAKLQHQEQFQQTLTALTEAQPALSRAQQWLSSGQHGQDWLYSHYKNSESAEQERQLASIKAVANALNQLPTKEQPERLAIFAQRTSGDPHNLDATNATGRLFLQALSDLSSRAKESGEQGRALELQLYEEVGLLVDTISSSIAVFSLYEAYDLTGAADPLIPAAGARILLLPLRQILSWQRVSATGDTIYVMENPQVFEEIVTRLQENPVIQNHPTLICTAGWPSVAALNLLDMLLQNNAEARLLYSGDFDLKGLQIAAYFLARYPGRSELWHLDPAAYTAALQAGGLPARTHELRQLDALPPAFSALVAQLHKHELWAYQEGITRILLNDLQNPGSASE
ncbi:MAG TPA: TIGR02679 family protein [Ktedonobacteraceae bacterium]|jgi:uncharacterized protein (TIGR02679 family)